ncbi:kinesin light chain [Rhizoctonia solani 123E]|uniref:Kinesin light chain n=1 Tax=Rhizoctonia solani 123E TaxID=1423351 RepID=A0A074S314_9AGAM|nr:kinesin light chain [Rhizoctonia solani 123E]
MQSNQEGSRGLNILCIDGGGVRGLSSLIILQEIMRRVENARGGVTIHPHEYFDVIAGTGTGGISACMLGRLRLSVDKAIEEYVKLVKQVFQQKKMSGPAMYRQTKLQEALKTIIREATKNEGEKMSEGQDNKGCKTMAFAMARHHLNAGLPVLFRSYTVSSNPGPDCAIWEALCATMAHPDLFKSIDIVESSVPQSFVGGELGCSNPLAHVLAEVKRLYSDRQVACIISIGAGHSRTIQVPNPNRWYTYRTQDLVVMKDMATDSERVAEEMMLRFQDTSGVYFRFSVDQGVQNMNDGSWERLGETMQHTKAYLRKNETDRKLAESVRASMEKHGVISTTHAAGQISHLQDVTHTLAGFKRCPAPTMFYTGRQDENTQVIACITGGKNERRVCVIHGLGGVGKTQLVLNVIERTWDEWDYIIYVDASSTEAVEKALTEFGTAQNVGESCKDVIRWLESCGEHWLVVFDNADTPSTNIRQYIPTKSRGGSVLITTRLPDLARLAEGPGCICHLSSMSQADGTALLVKIASLGGQVIPGEDIETAGELVQASKREFDFGGLALAIVHAGAYISHSPGMDMTKYLSLFSSQRQRMLDEYNELPVTAKLDERGDTVYTTWRMCYDQLKPESRELLWLIAYLHYDGIIEDTFKRATQSIHSQKYPLPPTNLESQALDHVKRYLSTFLDADGKWDTIKFTRVMADLTSYSLIDFDRRNLTYRVHVLVHDWAKTVVSQASELAMECTATLLSLSIDRKEDAESLAFKRQLGLHVTSVLTHIPNMGANHVYYLGEVYECTGQWSQRVKLLQPLLGVFKQLLGEEHPDTLVSMGSLASTYSDLGRYIEAEQLQVEVLNAHKQVLGEEHPDALQSMGSLASTYSHLGRYEQAEQLQVEVLNARKKILGEEHPDTLVSIGSLASTYSHWCILQMEQAEQLQIEVLNARKRVLGEEHPDTLASMKSLASTYSCLGRYKQAEQLQVKVLNARKQILGEEHPHTLTSMGSLASTYSNLGQYNEAEQLQVKVLNASKRVLGEEHPHTLVFMGTLASIYSRLGRYKQAEQLQVEVLDANKRVLGEEHPHTLISVNNLASTYSRLGQYEQAEQLQIEVLNARKQILGEEHPHTLQSMNNLASIYSHLGQYKLAEQLQAKVLDAHMQVLGEGHPHTLIFMNNLASTYSHLGRYEQAEQLQVKVLNTRKQVLGEEHPHTLVSMGSLASTYSNLGQYNKAEQLQVKVLNARKRVLGEEHPDTLVSMKNLASTYSCLGQSDTAKELTHKATIIVERTLSG